MFPDPPALSMPPDPLGRAVQDYYHDRQTEPLIDRDGATTREHAIERWYFGEHDPNAWRDQFLGGPLLDIGAGAGRDALYYQRSRETVALEISERLVSVMRDRGVADARQGDMFALTDQFKPDRFASVHAIGTQVGLAGSLAGVRDFLADLAVITTAEARVVFDNYAPDRSHDVFGVRPDPAPGMANRCYHEVYEGEVGPTLLFSLFDISRLQDTLIGTPWSICGVRHENTQYRVALAKSHD